MHIWRGVDGYFCNANSTVWVSSKRRFLTAPTHNEKYMSMSLCLIDVHHHLYSTRRIWFLILCSCMNVSHYLNFQYPFFSFSSTRASLRPCQCIRQLLEVSCHMSQTRTLFNRINELFCGMFLLGRFSTGFVCTSQANDISTWTWNAGEAHSVVETSLGCGITLGVSWIERINDGVTVS